MTVTETEKEEAKRKEKTKNNNNYYSRLFQKLLKERKKGKQKK